MVEKGASHGQEDREGESAQSREAAAHAKAESAALVPGTVLRKPDRKGKTRCECTVEAEGYRYKGTVYGSLSGAATAAAKDLGLSGTSFNGYVFWV